MSPDTANDTGDARHREATARASATAAINLFARYVRLALAERYADRAFLIEQGPSL
jgi:hypothetical protein